MPRVDCVIRITSDARGSGKTLLATLITRTLAGKGVPVVALKRIHHGGPDLLEGKDAERIFSSGALYSIAYGREYSIAIIRSPPDPLKLVGVLAEVLGLDGYVLLIEGLHDYVFPQNTLLLEVRLSMANRVYSITGSPCGYSSRGPYEATREGMQSLVEDLIRVIKQCCLSDIHT